MAPFLSFVKNARLFVSLVFLALFSWACSSGGSSTTNTPRGISITPNPAMFVAGGSAVPLSATLTLDTGAVDDTAVFTWQSSDVSIVTVDASSGIATGLKIGVATITASSHEITGRVTVGVVGPKKGATSLTLSGNATYEDRVYDLTGFTGVLVEKPIRKTVLEVVAIDGFSVIGTTASDAAGDYNITVDNSANQSGVYLRVVSRTDLSQTEKIEVRNNSTERAFLSFASPGLDDSVSEPFLATQDMLARAATRIGGAFNIIDVMSDASILLQSSGPCPDNPTCVPPLATVYWEPNSAEGSFYNHITNTISILGGGVFGGDTDEYDDVIIAHEYAHFIINQFARDDSPGGDHNILDNGQDIRLSWSEGWATFFPAAVLNSPLYVDTKPGGTLISFNIEDYSGPSALASNAIYTTNEIAVAGVLWDIFDEINNSEGDPLQLNFSTIFQTLLNFPASPRPTSLETFWTTFSSEALTTGSSAAFQSILQGRKISLFQDATEATELTLTSTASQLHTLYQAGDDPAGDVDIIPFNVTTGTSYTVRTFNLNNGADTFLSIRNTSGVIASNDNESGFNHLNCGIVFGGTSNCPANNALNLSSSVTFTAQETATFTAEVSHAQNAPPSAALLGAYEIDLATP